MKKIFALSLALLVIFGTSAAFLPSRAKAADLDLTGNWLVVLNYQGDIQMHDMTIFDQDQDGNLSGAGGFPHNETYSITWRLENSQIKGNKVNLAIYYDSSDYVVNLSGKIQPNGFAAGDWSDNRGLKGKWSAVPNKAALGPGNQVQ